MKTQKPQISMYLSHPSWIPNQREPNRCASWPSGLFYFAEYVCGDVRKVGIIPKGQNLAFIGWEVISETYCFRTRSLHNEWQEFTFKKGDILCRALGDETPIKKITPPNPLKWVWETE